MTAIPQASILTRPKASGQASKKARLSSLCSLNSLASWTRSALIDGSKRSLNYGSSRVESPLLSEIVCRQSEQSGWQLRISAVIWPVPGM
jgi:hypothetical protein